MKLGVVGSREFVDYDTMKRILNKINGISCIDMIVSGGANGADKLSERYAHETGLPCQVFRADWDKYGKRAGFLRNEQIVDASDMIVAFWDGQSSGTRHTIKLARKANKRVIIVQNGTIVD